MPARSHEVKTQELRSQKLPRSENGNRNLFTELLRLKDKTRAKEMIGLPDTQEHFPLESKVPRSIAEIKQEVERDGQTLEQSRKDWDTNHKKLFDRRAETVDELVSNVKDLKPEDHLAKLRQWKKNMISDMQTLSDNSTKKIAGCNELRLEILTPSDDTDNTGPRTQLLREVLKQHESWQEFFKTPIEHTKQQIEKLDAAIEKIQREMNPPKQETKVSRSIEELKKKVVQNGEKLTKYMENTKADIQKLREETSAVDKLVNMNIENLGSEATSKPSKHLDALQEKLANIEEHLVNLQEKGKSLEERLTNLQEKRKSINNELKTLRDTKQKKIADHSELRLETEQLGDSDEKKELLQKVKEQDIFWKAAYESPIKRVESQLQKLDTAIRQTQNALNITETRTALAKEQLQLDGYLQSFNTTIQGLYQYVNDRVIQPIEETSPASTENHIRNLNAAKKDLTLQRNIFSKEKIAAIGEYNGALSMIEASNDPAKEHLIKDVTRLDNALQLTYDGLVKYIELNIQRLDAAIEKTRNASDEFIINDNKLHTKRSIMEVFEKTTNSEIISQQVIKEPRDIKEIQAEVAREQLQLAEYSLFVVFPNQSVNDLLSQPIEETNPVSIENHIKNLENAKTDLDRQKNEFSNDKIATINRYNGLLSEIKASDDSANEHLVKDVTPVKRYNRLRPEYKIALEPAKDLLIKDKDITIIKDYNRLLSEIKSLDDPANEQLIKDVTRLDNTFQVTYDSLAKHIELNIQKIDVAISKMELRKIHPDMKNMIGELDNITQSITQQDLLVPHTIAEIRDEVAKHQKLLNRYQFFTNDRGKVLQNWDNLINNMVNRKIEGTSPADVYSDVLQKKRVSLQRHLANLQNTQTYLNGTLRALNKDRNAKMDGYWELRLEIKKLDNTPANDAHSSIEPNPSLPEQISHSSTDLDEKQVLQKRIVMQGDDYQSSYREIINRTESYRNKINNAINETQLALDQFATE